MNTLQSAATLLLGAALCACSTPQPVRDLASQGASMTDQAQRETHAFLTRAAEAYATRMDSAELRARRNAEDAADASFTAFISKQAGDDDPSERIALIRSVASESRRTREALEERIEQSRQALTVQPVATADSDKALAQAKKGFIVLAQELSAREWLQFGWKYFRQVKDAYKAPDASASK